MSGNETQRSVPRVWVARRFTAIEDVVYVGPGLLLAGSALVLLATLTLDFPHSVVAGTFAKRVTGLFDRMLQILLVVELLSTVQVSFREHKIAPEPFLIIGLIAAIRRVLVVTTEFGEVRQNDSVLTFFLIEIGAHTAMILVLVAALALLRRHGGPIEADRSPPG